MENKLIVNQMIPFSNVDGTGNRCAIFLQGCNVQCIYCHNPETIRFCNHCGDCIKVCGAGALTRIDGKVHYDSYKCVACQSCIKSCPSFSSPKTKAYTVDEIVQIVKSYQPFIRGITVSGGEPTLQHKLLVDLFEKVKALGLTCYVDTNGYFNLEELQKLIDITDKFLVDVKTVGDSTKLCQVPSLSSMENLECLLELDKVEEVRTVLIHSYMDCRETVLKVSKVLKNYPKVFYKLIKVHKIGIMDQNSFTDDFIPSDQEVLEWVQLAKACGLSKITYVL